MPAITIQTIDDLHALSLGLMEHARSLPHLAYADLRLEAGEGKAAGAENGQEKFSTEDYGLSFGVRVIGGDRLRAPGFFGRSVGPAELPRLDQILGEALEHAHARAVASAREKALLKDELGELGAALYDGDLAPIEVRQDRIEARYAVDPRTVKLADLTAYVGDVSRACAGVDGIAFNYVAGSTQLTRQLFVSTEGADIDQAWAISEGFGYFVGVSEQGQCEIYDNTGAQRGYEVLSDGVDEQFLRFPSLMDFATGLARDTAELARCRPLKATDEEVVVVTDPHFNALVSHEVVGHPTEADRALKYETAYAGRSWLLTDLERNQVGRQIASAGVNAYSDPFGLEGYGHYKYDDEGTPAKRVQLIEDGVFRGFMNSRQTAAILGAEPNGSYKAMEASYVPLIRMSNTVFAAGQDDPARIIKEVDRGYYLQGHRIPSIAESRENFRITAIKVYEIRNGELGELFRDGGITADTKDYFMSIDAVGSDFQLFSIPNCGKGQPMQTKRLGNGGPTMRGRARLTGHG